VSARPRPRETTDYGYREIAVRRRSVSSNAITRFRESLVSVRCPLDETVERGTRAFRFVGSAKSNVGKRARTAMVPRTYGISYRKRKRFGQVTMSACVLLLFFYFFFFFQATSIDLRCKCRRIDSLFTKRTFFLSFSIRFRRKYTRICFFYHYFFFFFIILLLRFDVMCAVDIKEVERWERRGCAESFNILNPVRDSAYKNYPGRGKTPYQIRRKK